MATMSDKDDLVPPEPRAERSWTRLEDYLDVPRYLRRYAARSRRRQRPVSEPIVPRLSLGTLPFLVLVLLLGVLAFAIILSAIPGRDGVAAQRRPTSREEGTAPPGWLERAGVGQPR